MNKYRDKSDFEINKAVADNYLPCDYRYNENDKIVELIGIDLSCEFGSCIDIEKEHVYGKFDPCNNPADAMPIVIENNIDLLNGDNQMPELFGHHSAYTLFNFSRPIASDSLKERKTIYRLAMEVFLMMKEAENEK